MSIDGTPFSRSVSPTLFADSGYTNSWMVAGYWQPLDNGWIPSISAGWGYNQISYSSDNADAFDFDGATSQSWYVGLNWKDLFAKGNALGFAVGQPTFVTTFDGESQFDGNYAFELFYKLQVTDNIAVTPALFWLSRPRGQMTSTGSLSTALRDPGFSNDDSLGTLGGLVQTTFRF